MVNIKYAESINTMSDDFSIIESVAEALYNVFKLDEFQVKLTASVVKGVYDIIPADSACYLELRKVDNIYYINIVLDGIAIYKNLVYSYNLEYDLKQIRDKGIRFGSDSYDFIIGKDLSSPVSLNSDDDEVSEIDSVMGKFAGQPTKIIPIIKGKINQIRVVPLKFNGVVIAYRFKTDIGAFDMSKMVAERYGLSSIKSDKFISLENINGIYMSSTERKLHQLVPEVSDCEEDCRQLIDAVFQCEG